MEMFENKFVPFFVLAVLCLSYNAVSCSILISSLQAGVKGGSHQPTYQSGKLTYQPYGQNQTSGSVGQGYPGSPNSIPNSYGQSGGYGHDGHGLTYGQNGEAHRNPDTHGSSGGYGQGGAYGQAGSGSAHTGTYGQNNQGGTYGQSGTYGQGTYGQGSSGQSGGTYGQSGSYGESGSYGQGGAYNAAGHITSTTLYPRIPYGQSGNYEQGGTHVQGSPQYGNYNPNDQINPYGQNVAYNQGHPSTSYPGQHIPAAGQGYPSSSGSSYPGNSYPGSSGSSYPGVSGSSYPGSSGSSYPGSSGSSYPVSSGSSYPSGSGSYPSYPAQQTGHNANIGVKGGSNYPASSQPHCEPACTNGVCIAENTCQCNPGYSKTAQNTYYCVRFSSY